MVRQNTLEESSSNIYLTAAPHVSFFFFFTHPLSSHIVQLFSSTGCGGFVSLAGPKPPWMAALCYLIWHSYKIWEHKQSLYYYCIIWYVNCWGFVFGISYFRVKCSTVLFCFALQLLNKLSQWGNFVTFDEIGLDFLHENCVSTRTIWF